MSPKLAVLLVISSLQCLLTVSSDPDPLQDFCLPNTNTPPSTPTRFHTPIPPCKNSSEATTDDFVFSGLKNAGNFSNTGFATIPVNPTNFPGLNTQGMSFVRADLRVGAINPPHFHPRATEITYVIKGSVYSGFVDSNNKAFARVLEEGEVMVFPRGLVHFQMNVGNKAAQVFGTFNSQNPGNQKIPSALFGSGIDDDLLGKAFGLSVKQIGMIRRRFNPKKIIGKA